jgi:hypothetical protein
MATVDDEIEKQARRREALRKGGIPMADEGLPTKKDDSPSKLGAMAREGAKRGFDALNPLAGVIRRKKAKDQAKALEDGY